MSYIDGIWGHHSLPYSMLNPGLPAKHHGHKPINQYTCDYCIERQMFTSNWALQIHISTSAGCHQRKLAKMANYSGTEPQKNFAQVQAERHELPDVGAELIYDPHMLDDPLDDPGDTCQPEAAPSDLDTGSDLGNVSDDSDRPGSGNNEPEDSDPDAEDNVPDPQDHSLYHLYDIQHAMGSVIKFRLERGTWANLATETQRMASFWCLRPQFGNTGSLYSPWKSKDKWELVWWLCKSELSQLEINLFLRLEFVSVLIMELIIR